MRQISIRRQVCDFAVCLCHADARQVFDLPKRHPLYQLVVSDRQAYGSETRHQELHVRQVKDLPRIGVAEPDRKKPLTSLGYDKLVKDLPRISRS